MKSIAGESSERRGVVLIVVLVLVVMIALVGFGFVSEMTTEYEATKINGDLLQAQQVMASAECYVLAQVDRMKQPTPEGGEFSVADRSIGFQAVTLKSSGGSSTNIEQIPDETEWRFAVVKDLSSFDSIQHQAQLKIGAEAVDPLNSLNDFAVPEFGLKNESAKLNLGRVLYWDIVEPGRGRRALMNLPGMTDEAADSILDWIDADDTPRQFGAEADYYRQQQLNVQPRNSIPETLTELLFVRGVNRNTFFGARSTAGTETNQGWSSLLTLTSAESTESSPPKIAVNKLTLADLDDFEKELANSVPKEVARYVVLSLMAGVTTSSQPGKSVSPLSIDLNTLSFDSVNTTLELPDLVDSFVTLPNSKAKGKIIVASPLTSEDPTSFQAFARLEQLLTAGDTSLPAVRGRINIFEAGEEALRALTDDPAAASQILQQRESLSDDERNSSVWLLSRRVLDLTTYRSLYSDITTGGDVYSGEIIVYRAVGGPFLRRKIAIDAANGPSRRINWLDVSAQQLPLTLHQLEPSLDLTLYD